PPPAAAAALVQVAAAPVQSGCDPNAAYDPAAPCTGTGTVAATPASASVLAYQPDDRASAAYDPNSDPGRYASAPQPALAPVVPPAVSLAVPKVHVAAVPA